MAKDIEQEDIVETETAVAAPARRTPGTKEVIPLVWKLVGMSAGMPVTLLKCVERSDAEAQLERLRMERYYDELAIYGIDEEVPLSSESAKRRKKAIEAALNTTKDRATKRPAAAKKREAFATSGESSRQEAGAAAKQKAVAKGKSGKKKSTAIKSKSSKGKGESSAKSKKRAGGVKSKVAGSRTAKRATSVSKTKKVKKIRAHK